LSDKACGWIDGRERLVAVHGNRFILFYVFNHLDLNKLKYPNVDLADYKVQCEKLALQFLEAVIPSINELFPDSYPGNIFKNQDRQLNCWLSHNEICRFTSFA